MLHPDDIRADFIQMVKRPEPSIDLARVALLVAAESDPHIDVDGELRTLESWAAELRGRLEPGWNNLQKLARLRAFVFEELGFRGDRLDYFSPSNSLLHQVIHRRRGIPITLAIVMMELGWRIGIPFEGIGFPGHFLVRLAGEPRDLILDPYRRGMSVHEEDCRRMLLETTGGKIEFEQAQLASVGKLEMIVRLLHNLKGAYLRGDENERALAAVERLLVLDPENADEMRDCGLLLFRLHRYGQALDSLTGYLDRVPVARDRETVARHVDTLRKILADLN